MSAEVTVQSPLLDVREAANRLGISDDLLYRLAREGEVPSIRVGGKLLRFDMDDLIWALKRRGATRA